MSGENKVVYSVLSVDVEPEKPIDTEIVESHADRNSAVNACIDYMVERMHLRSDIRYAMFHDINHTDINEYVAEKADVSVEYLESKFDFNLIDDWKMSAQLEKAVREYLSDAFSIGSLYQIDTDTESKIGISTYIFDVAESPMKE